MVFQSTHPHGVRQYNQQKIVDKPIISIHAPPWGATRETGLTVSGNMRFQSTHPHGVRHAKRDMRLSGLAFQSTHPHGVRLRSLIMWFHFFRISIHAPTWGATCKAVMECFDMRPFQSTHPHGVRHGALPQKPTSPRISIHAPTWGATLP